MNINVQQWITKFNIYLKSLTLYEQLAWGTIILGVVLVVMGLFLL